MKVIYTDEALRDLDEVLTYIDLNYPTVSRPFVQRLRAIRLDVREVLTVNPRCALVGAALSIGMRQNILAADLVVQDVEAIAGFCLRFCV
jgi:hypothetical protein